MHRKDPFTNNSIYHIYNRSIAKYRIFKSETDCTRMLELIRYYQYTGQASPFSDFIRHWAVKKVGLCSAIPTVAKSGHWTKVADVFIWCLIPNHYHFVMKQLREDGIQLCMGRALDGFTRYLNLRRNRRGPLWESRMQSKKILDRGHLATVIDYVHNNPVKHRQVKCAEDWIYSSVHTFDANLLERIDFK